MSRETEDLHERSDYRSDDLHATRCPNAQRRSLCRAHSRRPVWELSGQFRGNFCSWYIRVTGVTPSWLRISQRLIVSTSGWCFFLAAPELLPRQRVCVRSVNSLRTIRRLVCPNMLCTLAASVFIFDSRTHMLRSLLAKEQFATKLRGHYIICSVLVGLVLNHTRRLTGNDMAFKISSCAGDRMDVSDLVLDVRLQRFFERRCEQGQIWLHCLKWLADDSSDRFSVLTSLCTYFLLGRADDLRDDWKDSIGKNFVCVIWLLSSHRALARSSSPQLMTSLFLLWSRTWTFQRSRLRFRFVLCKHASIISAEFVGHVVDGTRRCLTVYCAWRHGFDKEKRIWTDTTWWERADPKDCLGQKLTNRCRSGKKDTK